MATQEEFSFALNDVYRQVFDCLPIQLRPSDCRLAKPGRCPAISNCQPDNGFLTPDGGCADGLWMVTRDIERLDPRAAAEVNCVAKFGLRLDLFLFPPCTHPKGCGPALSPSAQWALTCCLYGVNVNAAWWPGMDNRVCDRLLIDPVTRCVREGACKGASISFVLPIP